MFTTSPFHTYNHAIQLNVLLILIIKQALYNQPCSVYSEMLMNRKQFMYLEGILEFQHDIHLQLSKFAFSRKKHAKNRDYF